MSRKPTVPEVLPMVRQYYAQGHGAGGCLHIVLDDGNVRDDDVRWCLIDPRELSGPFIGEVDRDAAWLAHVLLRMSRTQRAKLYADRGKDEADPDWNYSVADACEALLDDCDKERVA